MENYDPLCSDFYFYIVGDKTTYSQELNDLFVCYTLTRGLQRHCTHPRRPAIPLELILRITRHAGFIDPKPDLRLTSDVLTFANSLVDNAGTQEFYMSLRLSRVQLASMARLQLASPFKMPKVREVPYDTFHPNPLKWAFIPLGTHDKFGISYGSQGIVASLFPCRDETEAKAVEQLTPGTVLSDTFTPDHAISKQLDEGYLPCIVIVAREPARLLVWRWWEPRFL
ncbi:hypothetical protein BDV93DRAFT_603754 [Ceratobasidium sp. AG-I]|nr:hypothetical protein BDV93DRAFT_603754 [Ceratobasidium sp. AG-I]